MIRGGDIRFCRMSSIENSLVVYPSSTDLIIGPKFLGNEPRKSVNYIPGLNIIKVNGGLVNSRSNAILTKDALLVDTHCSDESFNQGLILANDKEFAKIKMRVTDTISDGFFLGGLGSFNWYHWLIEILPKALYFHHLGTKTILLDESVIKFNTMLETLQIVLKDLDYNLIIMDKKRNYYVGKLYYLSAINYVPFNTFNNRSFTLEDFFYRKHTLQSLRKLFLENHDKNKKSKFKKKIYLNRKSHRIPKNHDELLTHLRHNDFEILSIDNLDFDEQIEVFQNAEIILGITGAGFTNLLFANPETRAYCISPSKENEFACFSILADIVGMNLIYIPYYLPDGIHHYSNEFRLDIGGILKEIEGVANNV